MGAVQLLLLAGCGARQASLESIKSGCHDDARCVQACVEADDETAARHCKLLQDDAYDRAFGHGAYSKARQSGASPAGAAPEAVAIERSEDRLGIVAIAARSRPAIVAVQTPSALGTGFAVNGLGWIVTNLHVVAGAERVTVHGADRHEQPVVEVVAYDPQRDLAVLRVERLYPSLPLDTRERALVGESVVAIGNPLGLEATVSTGIVSGLRVRDHAYEVLQISAPISPGSSGGPVVDDHGAVLGVATFTLTKGQNLNFAVPARYVHELLRSPHPMALATFAAQTKGWGEAPPPSAQDHPPAP